jgi:hypothetical protein
MNRRAWLVVASLCLFAYGAWCVVLSRRVEEQAGGLPRMTCDQLIQNGPRGNAFITLTDVRLCSAGYVFRRDMDAATRMYLPIHSARLRQEPRPRELTLLLEILDDRDSERLLAQPDVGELTCELWTRADQLDPWVREGLAAKYPGIQLKKCRVLSVGLHEPTIPKAQRIWWDAIVSLVLGATILVWVAYSHHMSFIRQNTGPPVSGENPTNFD